MSTRNVAAVLSTLAALAAILVWTFGGKPWTPSPEWMSDVMISRAGVGSVKFFVDRSHIHGLKSFFFQSSKPQKLIDLLDLNRVDSLPDSLRDRIGYLRSQVDWKFDWDRAAFYSAYYCNGPGGEFSVDLMMTSGSDVLFITNGYVSDTAKKVRAPEECLTKN